MYTENLHAQHLESGGSLPARWDYTSFDPYSLHLQLDVPTKGYIDWEFGRELVLVGLTSTDWVGEGDVKVCRADEDILAIRLSSPSGMATLLFPLTTMSRFIGRTILEMPIGDELIDTDWLATT